MAYQSFDPPRVPSLRRRLACFIYEGVLLFGVLMISGYLFSSLSQQRHALVGRSLLQAFLFLVIGTYFVWFWSHGGQTVAMKAWNVRLVSARGDSVSQPRALLRYLLCWLWFVPALLCLWVSGTKSLATMLSGISTGVLVYACLSLLREDHQFAHDALCGTRLVSTTAG